MPRMFADGVCSRRSPEHAVPLRHIPLNERGDTVNSFYEWGTEEELETALGSWLIRTIRNLESREVACA